MAVCLLLLMSLLLLQGGLLSLVIEEPHHLLHVCLCMLRFELRLLLIRL